MRSAALAFPPAGAFGLREAVKQAHFLAQGVASSLCAYPLDAWELATDQ